MTGSVVLEGMPCFERVHSKASAPRRAVHIVGLGFGDVFAVRVFEKRLSMLSLTDTRKKNADGSPPRSVCQHLERAQGSAVLVSHAVTCCALFVSPDSSRCCASVVSASRHSASTPFVP